MYVMSAVLAPDLYFREYWPFLWRLWWPMWARVIQEYEVIPAPGSPGSSLTSCRGANKNITKIFPTSFPTVWQKKSCCLTISVCFYTWEPWHWQHMCLYSWKQATFSVQWKALKWHFKHIEEEPSYTWASPTPALKVCLLSIWDLTLFSDASKRFKQIKVVFCHPQKLIAGDI